MQICTPRADKHGHMSVTKNNEDKLTALTTPANMLVRKDELPEREHKIR